jgi:hypothetical protein
LTPTIWALARAGGASFRACFVSIGLLLTFLGLIAALTAIGGDEINDDSLRGLLNAASAKFIMSLTGLACSIFLTFLFRLRADAVDRQVRRLGHALEKRLRFQSLEEIAANQLHVMRQQDDALRRLATEMVAELARPLREELPAAIGTSSGPRSGRFWSASAKAAKRAWTRWWQACRIGCRAMSGRRSTPHRRS